MIKINYCFKKAITFLSFPLAALDPFSSTELLSSLITSHITALVVSFVIEYTIVMTYINDKSRNRGLDMLNDLFKNK